MGGAPAWQLLYLLGSLVGLLPNSPGFLIPFRVRWFVTTCLRRNLSWLSSGETPHGLGETPHGSGETSHGSGDNPSWFRRQPLMALEKPLMAQDRTPHGSGDLSWLRRCDLMKMHSEHVLSMASHWGPSISCSVNGSCDSHMGTEWLTHWVR